MKRTTIYFDPDLEARLKAEVLRRGKPMAALVREALRAYLTHDEPKPPPPGAGEFASGRSGGADRVEELLTETGFGEGR